MGRTAECRTRAVETDRRFKDGQRGRSLPRAWRARSTTIDGRNVEEMSTTIDHMYCTALAPAVGEFNFEKIASATRSHGKTKDATPAMLAFLCCLGTKEALPGMLVPQFQQQEGVDGYSRDAKINFSSRGASLKLR